MHDEIALIYFSTNSFFSYLYFRLSRELFDIEEIGHKIPHYCRKLSMEISFLNGLGRFYWFKFCLRVKNGLKIIYVALLFGEFNKDVHPP